MTVAHLVYVAFALALAAYLMRDELWLRALMLCASAIYLLYYYSVADRPLWDAILTSGFLAAVNFAMIVVVVLERSTFGMTSEIASIYRSFPMLTPGQFRRIIRSARHQKASHDVRLTVEDEPVEKLYFITDGAVTVTKQGEAREVPARLFVGEIAYATGLPASATVNLVPGSSYLEWDREALRRLERRSPSLRVALMAQFNADLLRKVARSQPMGAVREAVLEEA